MPVRGNRLDMSGLVRTLAQDRADASHMNDLDQAQAMQIQAMTQGVMNRGLDADAARTRAGDAKSMLAMRLSAQKPKVYDERKDELERYKADKNLEGRKYGVDHRPQRTFAPRPAPQRKETPEERLRREVILKAMGGAHGSRNAGDMSGRAYNDPAAERSREDADSEMNAALMMMPPELREAFKAKMAGGAPPPDEDAALEAELYK